MAEKLSKEIGELLDLTTKQLQIAREFEDSNNMTANPNFLPVLESLTGTVKLLAKQLESKADKTVVCSPEELGESPDTNSTKAVLFPSPLKPVVFSSDEDSEPSTKTQRMSQEEDEEMTKLSQLVDFLTFQQIKKAIKYIYYLPALSTLPSSGKAAPVKAKINVLIVDKKYAITPAHGKTDFYKLKSKSQKLIIYSSVGDQEFEVKVYAVDTLYNDIVLLTPFDQNVIFPCPPRSQILASSTPGLRCNLIGHVISPNEKSFKLSFRPGHVDACNSQRVNITNGSIDGHSGAGVFSESGQILGMVLATLIRRHQSPIKKFDEKEKKEIGTSTVEAQVDDNFWCTNEAQVVRVLPADVIENLIQAHTCPRNVVCGGRVEEYELQL